MTKLVLDILLRVFSILGIMLPPLLLHAWLHSRAPKHRCSNKHVSPVSANISLTTGKAYLEQNDYTNAINSFEMALDVGIEKPEDARDARELLTIARTKKTLNSVTRNW